MSAGPPTVVLGVSRSGTTLLKEMLDRHPDLAIPGESYFISQLWDRHGERPHRDQFLADVSRLGTLREWGVTAAQIEERLPPAPAFDEAIEAMYRAYAERRGKARFGDKTPAYMERLDAVQRAFPGARYVHLVRDGRDAALSFAAMERRPTFNLARPRTLRGFVAQWDREVRAARRLGQELGPRRYMELRYEDLVDSSQELLEEVCRFLELEPAPEMLEYHQDAELARRPDHARLAQPPAPGRSQWREQMRPPDIERSEAIAGPLLSDLGYERAHPRPRARMRARAALTRAGFGARVAAWKWGLALYRKGPVWRVRQAYMRRRLAREGGQA